MNKGELAIIKTIHECTYFLGMLMASALDEFLLFVLCFVLIIGTIYYPENFLDEFKKKN